MGSHYPSLFFERLNYDKHPSPGSCSCSHTKRSRISRQDPLRSKAPGVTWSQLVHSCLRSSLGICFEALWKNQGCNPKKIRWRLEYINLKYIRCFFGGILLGWGSCDIAVFHPMIFISRNQGRRKMWQDSFRMRKTSNSALLYMDFSKKNNHDHVSCSSHLSAIIIHHPSSIIHHPSSIIHHHRRRRRSRRRCRRQSLSINSSGRRGYLITSQVRLHSALIHILQLFHTKTICYVCM